MLSMKNIQIAPGISGLFRKTAITLAAAGMAAAIAISGIIAPAPAGAQEGPPITGTITGVIDTATEECRPTELQKANAAYLLVSAPSQTQSGSESIDPRPTKEQESIAAAMVTVFQKELEKRGGAPTSTTGWISVFNHYKAEGHINLEDILEDGGYPECFVVDTPPPGLPSEIHEGPDPEYDPAADHPEVYVNDEYAITARRTDDGNLLINLGEFTDDTFVTFSVWVAVEDADGGGYFSSAEHHVDGFTFRKEFTETNIGNTITLSHPEGANLAQSRFRIDGNKDGLRQNLVLGYLDLHTDDPSDDS